MLAPCDVELIQATERLEALAPDWWDLWRRCPEATPFQSPAWLLAWWQQFHPGRLAVFGLHCRGRLAGLAPFYLEEPAAGARLLPVGISLSDHLDILLDPDLSERAARALSAALVSELDWASCSLEELAPDAAALRLERLAGCNEDLREQSACPILQLDQCAGEVPRAIPAEQRRKLRRARRRAEARGACEIVPAANDSLHFLSELAGLHAARWRERGEAGVLADARVRAFHSAALPRLAAAGVARLFLLTIGGETVAAYYGFLHGDRAYAYLGGFDPAFAEESPGAILIGHAIARAAAEGARSFDFLRGRESYKYAWGAHDTWNKRRCFDRGRAA